MGNCWLSLVWRGAWAGLILSSVAIGAERPATEKLPTQASAAETSSFTSPAQLLLEHFVRPVGKQLQGLTETVNLPRRPATSRSFSPQRQIVLLGGDRITAEIVGWKNEAIELLMAGGQRVSLPRAAVVSVASMDGEVDLLYESFEPTASPTRTRQTGVERTPQNVDALDPQRSASGKCSLLLEAAPVTYTLREPPESSRIQFWFRVDEATAATRSELRVQFHFQGDVEAHWHLTAGERRASLTTQHPESTANPVVILKSGWHCLTAVLGVDRAFCCIDDALIGSTPRSPGRLRSLQLKAQGAVWMDDLIISQTQAVPAPPVRPSAQDDCVALRDGEQLYGRVNHVTAEEIILTGQAGDRAISWQQANRIMVRQVDRMVSGRPAQSGLWARIDFQSTLDRPRQSGDYLEATITDINRDFLTVTHPWLGEFAIGWRQIARIEPRSFGRRLVVDGRRMHLGDTIRDDFQRPFPDASEWVSNIDTTIEAISPDTEVWLSLDLAEVEPASPETPPASPFLKDLRSGKLLTEVIVNGHPLGSLNAHVRFRSPPDQPQHLRLRIPRSSWNQGPNVIKLHQIPLKDAGTVFDNCELSNLSLEFVNP